MDGLTQAAPAAAVEPLAPGSIGLTAEGTVILPGEQPGQAVTPETKPYTPEEVAATGIDKLDPARIPPELQPFYKSMQADYVRKTQQLAEMRRSMETPAAPAVPVAPQAQPSATDMADRIYQATVERACAIMGVGRNDFDEFDPKHQVFLSMASQQLQAEAAQQLSMQRHMETRQAEYTNLLQRYEATEPHYAEISAYADEWIENLPFAQYRQVMETLRSAPMSEVESKIIQEVRKAWYAKQGQATPGARPPAAAPVVETGIPGATSPPAGSIPTSFGRMTPEEQAQVLLKAGLV